MKTTNEMETNKIVRSQGVYKFDSSSRSWRGPVTGSQQTLPITRHHKQRERQLSQQTPENARQHKQTVSTFDEEMAATILLRGDGDNGAEDAVPNHQDVDSIHTDGSDEGNEEPVDVRLDMSELQACRVEEPFSQRGDRVYASWHVPPVREGNAPATKHSSSRGHGFTWEKSSQVPGSENISNLHVRRIEACLEEKEYQLQLLRTQLSKAHKANHHLTTQLDRFTGMQYQDLDKENKALKIQLGRLQRQNSRIESQLAKIQRHGIKNSEG